MWRVLPPTKKILQPYLLQDTFERRWLNAQQCCKTSCTYFVDLFTVALRKRRYWATLVNRKPGLFPVNALRHYSYCLYSYRGNFLENSVKTTAQECKQIVTFSWCASSKTSRPNIKIKILICYSLYISYRTSREKLLKYQSNLCDMSLILVSNLCYKALILRGEIWRWSLAGLKGLSSLFTNKTLTLSRLRRQAIGS